MSKLIAFAFALVGLAAEAHAADADSGAVKDPLPDTLTWNGVTVYGTIDVAYGYQSHGAPLNGSFPQGVAYNIYSSKYANRAISSLDPNAIERSAIGLKVEEAVGGGWVAIGKLETSFDPLTGQLSNGPASLLQNAGIPLVSQSANGDSGRAGQALNGPAYAGVSNSSYGTLTVGRQQSLQLDAASTYDPQGLSYAFSLLGWSSSLVGSGITEAARWNESVKYIYEYGPVHAAAQYANGGPDVGFFGPAYGFNAGGTYGGFSIDAVYQKVDAGVQLTANASTPSSIYAAPATFSTTTLKGQISDNESWSVEAKYSLNLGEGLKDEMSAGRLTFFGGYENISYSNSNPVRSAEYIGQAAIAGYIIGAASSSSYLTPRILQLGWTGANYQLSSGWSITAAFYTLSQNHYLGAATAPLKGAPNQQAGNLAGTANDASFVIGYRFNKHFDVYGGVNYSTIDGGLASGYLANDNTSVVTGARLKF